MEAISRRLWLTWSAAACGMTALGCRTPGMGDLTLSRRFAQPSLTAESLAQPEAEEQPSFAAPAADESSGLSMTLSDQPAAVGWTDDYEQALAQAGSQGKLVLAFFTGSDFCQPCRRLHEEVVETPEFQSWAAERFVLLELDYPRRTPQPPALQEQNRELLSRYGVRSFPTVLALSADGRSLAKAAYRPGGPTPWIQALEAQLGG